MSKVADFNLEGGEEKVDYSTESEGEDKKVVFEAALAESDKDISNGVSNGQANDKTSD